MTEYHMGEFEVAVVGGGHAGIEAALAAARLGANTALFTLTLDGIANMPCNPAIGGTAKGQLVREIDALGGQMGIAADKTTLQSRMLNRGKGPAVHSLRVQSDRAEYRRVMKETLEHQENLRVIQAEITEVRADETGAVCGVVTRLGAYYAVKACIICAGTFLNGKIFAGEGCYSAGPDGMLAATGLTESLKSLGVSLRRFKTGTPARVHRRSIDFSRLERQPGEEPVTPFSYLTETPPQNICDCYIAYTNEKTHQVIRDNIHRSPLFSGQIEGIGPRYCPSIEDKVVRFPHKERHQIFVEPCGESTEEMYLQGMSSSLPEDVVLQFLRTIEGFENIQIMRNAYAIEYDCCDPLQLTATLEFKDIPGLYGAGQFNGTSGYEEAAGQGLIAGVNAARKLQGKSPFTLERDEAYIGTLIDDLITKGCNEPYRMMTSRSEFRLLLRHDNADFRLTEKGYEMGLVTEERYRRFRAKKEAFEAERKRVGETVIRPSEALNRMLEEKGTSPISLPVRERELLKRPQLCMADLAPFDPGRPVLSRELEEQIDIDIKYEGYITRQEAAARQLRRLSDMEIPADLDYRQISGLRLEAAEKLSKLRPATIGQASRISGVSPADVSVLIIRLNQLR